MALQLLGVAACSCPPPRKATSGFRGLHDTGLIGLGEGTARFGLDLDQGGQQQTKPTEPYQCQDQASTPITPHPQQIVRHTLGVTPTGGVWG